MLRSFLTHCFRHALFFCILGAAPRALALGKILIVVSVDWEGRNLDPENLNAMKTFRQDYPEIPLQHFLNAAYFTKKSINPKEAREAIRSVIQEGDEHGLHIHAWRSLMEAARVDFKTEPAFKGPLDLKACDPDCGHDVNITAYSEADFRKVIRFSLKTLEHHGFDRARSFRAGAWQADKKILSALAHEGFTLDSSATDAEYLKERWGKSLLYPVVKKIWPGITAESQPYWVDLPSGKGLWELPNNGCLADYTSPETIVAAFKKNAVSWQKDPSATRYFSIGFHQETAKKYLGNLRSGIDEIKKIAISENIPIEFVVAPTDRFRREM